MALKLFLNAFEHAWAPFYFSIMREADAKTVFRFVATWTFVVLGGLGAAIAASGAEIIQIMTTPVFHGAAQIVPWNYPLLLLSWKVAPALAAGNTIVAKPSELTPLSTLALAVCFEHLPAGVINILAGAGEVGEAIVADERVDCVAFTGSVETGKNIAHVCADRVARIDPREREHGWSCPTPRSRPGAAQRQRARKRHRQVRLPRVRS